MSGKSVKRYKRFARKVYNKELNNILDMLCQDTFRIRIVYATGILVRRWRKDNPKWVEPLIKFSLRLVFLLLVLLCSFGTWKTIELIMEVTK